MATGLSKDEPPPHQAANNKKYRDPAFDDKTIEGLMNYFKFETYRELCWFLQRTRKH